MCLPDNLGTIPENLHVNIAGSICVSYDIDLVEFSLSDNLKRRRCI